MTDRLGLEKSAYISKVKYYFFFMSFFTFVGGGGSEPPIPTLRLVKEKKLQASIIGEINYLTNKINVENIS